MMLELLHDQRMAAKYQIINVSEGFPPTDSTYHFGENTIEIAETVIDAESHYDPWDNQIALANISVKVNGSIVDTLDEHPVRVEEVGLNRYFGEIAYLKVKDLKKKETNFFIILKKTRELTKEKPNGDIVGWVPDEKLTYQLYSINEVGEISQQSFSFTNRDPLQTELLNKGTLGPHRIGYYTDLWEGYPTLFFPLSYPFGTMILGFILLIAFWPFKSTIKRSKK